MVENTNMLSNQKVLNQFEGQGLGGGTLPLNSIK